MDELSNLSEHGAGQTDAQDTAHAESNTSSNGETSPATPRNVSRTITSKRVVIPPNAKRIAKAAPRAAVSADITRTPVEPAPEFPPNGETPSRIETLPPLEPPTVTLPLEPVVTPPPMEAPAMIAPFEPVQPLPPVEPPTVPAELEPVETLPQVEQPAASVPFVPAQPLTPRSPNALETNARLSAPAPVPDAPSSKPSPPLVEISKQIEVKPSPIIYQSARPKPSAPPTKANTLPHAPTPPAFAPIPRTQPRKRSGLEFLLWTTGIVLLIVAVLAALFALNLLPDLSTFIAPALPTQVAVAQPTTQPSPTTTLLPTTAPTTAPLVPTTAPLVIPTPPVDGQQSSILVDSNLTGWFTSGEDTPHYGDDNLNAGTFQGKSQSSILQFNLNNLPTDTKILFAAIELTGRDQSHLGTDGTWQLELLENSLSTDWENATPEQLEASKSLGVIGDSLNASDLGAGRLNRFILSDTELQMLEQQFKNGNAVFRLRGPSGATDNLFSWDSGATGSTLNSPTLHLVYVPGKYVIVTNTPEPTNVLTAAAYVVRGTDQAKRKGTPTSFPPGVATATPGGAPIIISSETVIPENQETAVALVQRATAFARTTGTYTPTPPVVIIQFPTLTPVVISEERLATGTPIPPDTDLLTIPIDYERCKCQGRIILLSNRYGGEKPSPIMIEPDGTPLGKLSGDLFYKLPLAREPYSPDRTKRLVYPVNDKGVQQIGYETLATGEVTILTKLSKGLAYDAAWAPDGSAIAFIATDVDNADQMYVYDFGTEQVTRIIPTPGGQPWFKHPSWSPDSQQIVYWSSISGIPQIWVVNRDGSNPHNISNNNWSETDPVWVK